MLNEVFKGEKKSEISEDLTCALEAIAKKFLDLKRLGGPRGKAPTLDQVIEFSMEQEKRTRYEHAGACVEEFFYYYEANGWVQGKGGIPIKDWQAAFRRWVLSQEGKPLKARVPFHQEIQSYADQLGGDASGQVVAFYDHYSANGWRQGSGNQIVDWKASFRSWVSRDIEGTAPGKKAEREFYDPLKCFEELA
ncbi:hypothetical protein [Stieleria neptunia]|nr:hypothetical protein [Stieleria neptunia]